MREAGDEDSAARRHGDGHCGGELGVGPGGDEDGVVEAALHLVRGDDGGRLVEGGVRVRVRVRVRVGVRG